MWTAAPGGCGTATGTSTVRVYPVGVDVDALRERLAHPRVRSAAQRLDALVGDRRLVVRVERMEPAKNAVRGITAFGDFLAAHPDQTDRVVHHVIAYTSRAGLDSYQRYAAQVHAAARAVNARFGTATWTPVVLDTTNDFEQGLALMARADVLVVNPVRDGMNLVAKEGAAVNDRDLAVILSQEAGAAEELDAAALLVDPLDTAELTTALAVALSMPAPATAGAARQRRCPAAEAVAGRGPCRPLLAAADRPNRRRPRLTRDVGRLRELPAGRRHQAEGVGSRPVR